MPAAAWTKKYHNWIRVQGKCVWCGDAFAFYASLGEDGKPRGMMRYCGRSCIAEARWENRRKVPAARVLHELYVKKQMSTPAIARLYRCAPASVNSALRAASIPIREHTSVRTCTVCGAPAEKRFHYRRSKKDGARIVFGTRCEAHRRAHSRAWYHRRSREKDPLIGTRKTGRKGNPATCPKCRKQYPTTREAVRCCNQRWPKVREFNRQQQAEAA